MPKTPEPTTPGEHDKPVFQPTTPKPEPTPDDPRQREPIQDPPVDPEHDGVPRRACADTILYDENRKPG